MVSCKWCTLKLQIDINCDLGESYGPFKVGNDEKIMPHITSANIACGFHAGDPLTIMRTVALAKKCDVAVGAHPGYPDLLGFGRREMQLAVEEVKNYLIYQISALDGFAKANGVAVQHVKPHGALYNKAARDEETSRGVVEAIEALDRNLVVFAPPQSVLAKVAAASGLRVAYEVFADRAYNSDGSLVSRTKTNAIIENPQKAVERAISMVREKTVEAVNGETLNFGEVHTICVHGDTPSALRLAESLKRGLIKARVEVKPVSSFVHDFRL